VAWPTHVEKRGLGCVRLSVAGRELLLCLPAENRDRAFPERFSARIFGGISLGDCATADSIGRLRRRGAIPS